MIMDLPIFFPDNKRSAKEAQKGINLRFLNANNRELGCISRMAVPGNTEGINAFCENNQKIHVGIGLFDSKDIKELDNLANFLLFVPLASAGDLENTFHFILAKWEAEAIKKYLDYCEIYPERAEERATETGEAKIITDFDENDPYLGSFKLLDGTPINIGDEGLARELGDKTAIIVIAKEKWKTLRRLMNAMTLKKKVVITTSSIEDWQVPPPIREMCAKNVVYTYPTVAENSKNIINQFEQKFGYKPSIYSLLAYDAADIAMKALSNAGPGYEAMKQYLEVTEFDTITMGKIGFGENSNPYLIGRNFETLFDIKHIDSKGRYRKEQVES